MRVKRQFSEKIKHIAPAIAVAAVAALCVYNGLAAAKKAAAISPAARNFCILITAAAVLIAAIALVMLRQKRVKGVRIVRSKLLFCLIAAAAIGCALLLPPLSGPDESAHYATVYRYSNILLGLEDASAAPKSRSMGLVSYDTLYRAEDAEMMNDYNSYTPDWAGLYAPAYEDFSVFSQDAGTVRDGHLSTPYAIFGYLPAILGLTLGRVLGLSAVLAAFTARLFNLLLCAALIARAIKKSELLPRVPLFVALFPMTLHLIGTLSPDGLWVAVGFTAYLEFSKLCAADQPLRAQDTVPFAMTCALASMMKGVFAPLCLLVLLPGMKRYRAKKDFYLSGLLALAATFTALLAANLPAIRAALSGAGAYYGDAVPLSEVLASPGEYILMFLRSVLYDVPMLALTMAGYSLGAFAVQLPSYLYAACFPLIALLAALPMRGDKEISVAGRAFLIPIALLTLLPAYGAMLLWWTPRGSGRILGVQGRYFLPVLPFGLAALSGLKARRIDFEGALFAAAVCLVCFALVNLAGAALIG